MEELETKYINLLLSRCINFNQCKALLIVCQLNEHYDFALKVREAAKQMGITNVTIDMVDLDELHRYLMNTDIEDISVNHLIDRKNWNNHAILGAPILFLNTTVPGLMNDIPTEKIEKMVKVRNETSPYYRANVTKYIFPWCIAALPNKRWAQTIFGDVADAYDKLYLNIMKMCMIDRENPVLEWENFIKESNKIKNRLNELEIKTMHYRNSLGTDLTIGLPEGHKWTNLDKKDIKGGLMIANMPSYEIFTSPDYRLTNGVVYSSRPLFYNDSCIKDFSIEFKNGEVIGCTAKEGLSILKNLIFNNENAKFLGEVALVPYNSPISNTGLVFNETLFDENASCHLALGNGFPNSLKSYTEKMSEEELRNLGINSSDIHVDFMIGTPDLEIEAETKEGPKLIFKNGNFNL